MSRHPAVFLDRDNTLIPDPGYISHPDQVQLFEDSAEAVADMALAGYRVVVVTNQSGIARGIISEDDLEAIHHRLRDLLADNGAAVDAVYSCPYLDSPEATVEKYRKASTLRKPQPGMLLLAAREMDLDLARSWMIGNSARDVEAGHRAGCRTILVERNGPDEAARESQPTHVVCSLLEAAHMVQQTESPERTESAEVSGANRRHEVPSQARGPDDQTVDLLAEIRDLLDRAQRRQRQQDFSVRRLAGTLVQMLAVVAALWALTALFSSNAAGPTLAIARFALAIFLQLAALCLTLPERPD